MQLRQPLVSGLVAATWISLLAVAVAGQERPCPPIGAALNVRLSPPAGGSESTATVHGLLLEASCTPDDSFSEEYTEMVVCSPSNPATCVTATSNLQPGLWLHEILVTAGDSAGQKQARSGLLLSAGSGGHSLSWPLYRSVTTVTSLSDEASCTGCLREALMFSETAPKPTLIQFAPDLTGSIVLSAALPPIVAGDTTIDGFDASGRPHLREIDADGIDGTALRVTSANNTIEGLRLGNAGGNSDIVLIEGAEGHDNLLHQLQIVGRAETVCGEDLGGCMVDGMCRTADCGDDGIAIRGDAGQLGANIVRDCEVVGAFDKGVKISNGGVARVEHSHIHDNRDGGMQATLSGGLVAVENLIELNRGTNSANGLAANGSDVDSPAPSRLRTQGNISRWNSLRGISIIRLSEATLRNDYVCGNGTPGRGIGFGILVDDADGLPATATAEGLGIVHNLDGGVTVATNSTIDLGGPVSEGFNALAFNGAGELPSNLRNTSVSAVWAANNYWEHCGNHLSCNDRAVLLGDVFQSDDQAVAIQPTRANRARTAIEIDSISPSFAAAGELVRLYGRGFDAIEGNAAGGGCGTVAEANQCRPVRGNCVLVGRQPADVVAVTPRMLVIRAPFTCLEPTTVTIRNRRKRGLARHDFCVVE